MPRRHRSLTYARLREMLDYDPLTGIFTWLGHSGCRTAGRIAGSAIDVGGRIYVEIKIDRTSVYAHILAVFYMTREWPREMVGFIDGDGANLVFTNLLLCTPAELQRRSLDPIKGNKTGFRGVSVLRGEPRRFFASIKVDGKKIALGRYDDPHDAYEDYLAAKALMHGVDIPYQARRVSPR